MGDELSAQQYPRKATIAVGIDGGAGQDYSAFRCVFNIRRGDFQSPNSCDLRIYNLSDATANAMANTKNSEFQAVSISAGYEGNFGLIFNGTIKQVRKGRENQRDTYVDITAADGDSAYNFATINQSLAARGANPDGMASALFDAMRAHQIIWNQGNPDFSTNNPVRGRVLYGMTRDELREFAAANNCSWSIQDGQLTFVPLTSYLPGEAIVVSSLTGLIGVPEQTSGGIKMRTLLNPNLKIGQTVKLDNKDAINQYRYGLDFDSQVSNQYLNTVIQTSADGLYYVMVANHSGDTRGQAWYSDITCLSVDAALPLNFAEETNPLYSGPVPVNRY